MSSDLGVLVEQAWDYSPAYTQGQLCACPTQSLSVDKKQSESFGEDQETEAGSRLLGILLITFSDE